MARLARPIASHLLEGHTDLDAVAFFLTRFADLQPLGPLAASTARAASRAASLDG